MQQLSLSELISICAGAGYISLDIATKFLKYDSKFLNSIISTCGGLIAIWITADPYPITDLQWIVAGLSGLLSKFLIASFKNLQTLNKDTRIDEILNIVKRLEK
jgi:hypothetical protein